MNRWTTAMAVLAVTILVSVLAAYTPAKLDSTTSKLDDTSFNYWGEVMFQDEPFSGEIAVDFILFGSPEGFDQIGPRLSIEDLRVVEGLFVVTLDFQTPVAGRGAKEAWLEIVIEGIPLRPRQLLSGAVVQEFVQDEFDPEDWDEDSDDADASDDGDDAVLTYLDDSRVVYAEPDYFAERMTTIPNDPMYGQLWGMTNARAPQAWSYYIGHQNKRIAVIDTGIVVNHPDLAANLLGGLNVAYPPGHPEFQNPSDQGDACGWHGSHVAGTIAARGNNGLGVVGMNWHASLVVLKAGILIDGMCPFVNTPIALELAYLNGYTVSNNSYGGSAFQQSQYDMILAGQQQQYNHVFVAAAGNHNQNNDINSAYPASYDLDNIISVAAINPNEQLASFGGGNGSHYGVVTVDIAAAGVDVLSTIGPVNHYDSYPGTSMASPHVAGAVALIQASHGDALPWQIVKDRVLESARPLPALSGLIRTGGTLDVAAAIRVYGSLVGNPQQGIGSYRRPFRTLEAAVANTPPNIPLALFAGTSNFTGDLNQPIIMTSVGGEVVFGVQAGAMPPPSCAGFCGGSPAQQCWCDESCCAFGDCCANKHATCGGCNPEGGGGNPNSCAGNCGGQAAGGCWCDAECIANGDCCADACAACPQLPHCGGGGNPNSCVGHCGNVAPGGCWCDADCCGFGDCCADKNVACPPACP